MRQIGVFKIKAASELGTGKPMEISVKMRHGEHEIWL
jgi:hypothetical protein